MKDINRSENRQISIISEMGFPIRTCPDQRVLAPPRALSQRATSFIASYRQDIHQMPFGT